METESKLESPLNYKHTPEFWELTNFFFLHHCREERPIFCITLIYFDCSSRTESPPVKGTFALESQIQTVDGLTPDSRDSSSQPPDRMEAGAACPAQLA